MSMVLSGRFSLLLSLFLHIALFSSLCFGGDPSIFTELHVSYSTVSPLGIPQRVCSSLFPFSSIHTSLILHLGHSALLSVQNHKNKFFLSLFLVFFSKKDCSWLLFFLLFCFSLHSYSMRW